ncbi:coiled-coil domain-containing protein 93 isoform X2 [Prorops nasuta]
MTWCIESCYFDIDIDLLFQENLTIGQKISLTEKIVAMLPKMNCPHRIEPHQIQGLDSIHIFPVIQWLVKRSMEMRKETAGFLRDFAINQFNKRHCFSEDKANSISSKENIIKNIYSVRKSYEPQRLFKHKEGTVKDESKQFLFTLLEYEAVLDKPNTDSCGTSSGSTAVTSSDVKQKDISLVPVNDIKSAEEIRENLTALEENVARLSINAVGNIVGIQAQEIAKVAEKYASMSISESEENKVPHALASLQKQQEVLQNRISKFTKEKDKLTEEIIKLTERSNESRTKKDAIEQSLIRIQAMDNNQNDSVMKRLEELLSVHEGLKRQEHDFREQCKVDLNHLRDLLEEIESGAPVEEEDKAKEYEEQNESVTRVRLQLAKKYRAIASLTRQLDDVPGRSELTQYQRRFMELYNQVSAKHKETKQYYTLYNTLDDTKLYLSKELSLLNSIQDNYNEAMASASGKEQFLKQFEAIVEGVKRNKMKVEKRCSDEKHRRDVLSQQLVTLIEQQRKYVAAVRQLTIECRKNEALLAQLRGS